MKLNIGKDYVKELTEDVCNLSTAMLSSPAVHMFIASNSWAEIHIDVDDNIDYTLLKFFPMACRNITVSLPERCTITTVGILSSLYPDLSGKLRRAFMTGGSIEEVLENCVVS